MEGRRGGLAPQRVSWVWDSWNAVASPGIVGWLCVCLHSAQNAPKFTDCDVNIWRIFTANFVLSSRGCSATLKPLTLKRQRKNSVKVLPQYFAYGRVSWQDNYSLHESNFACYICINGITGTADEYNFTSYNCISKITICGRTVEEDYPTPASRLAEVRSIADGVYCRLFRQHESKHLRGSLRGFRHLPQMVLRSDRRPRRDGVPLGTTHPYRLGQHRGFRTVPGRWVKLGIQRCRRRSVLIRLRRRQSLDWLAAIFKFTFNPFNAKYFK